MMVTNFALIVLVLWAGSVPVVIPKHYGYMNRNFWGQSVCNKYTLPVNMMWTLRARCEDSKRFQCQPGYQSQVQTNCRNGLWYTEPTCQVVGCSVAYQEKNETFVNNIFFLTSLTLNQKYFENSTVADAECTELCNNNSKCGFPFLTGTQCQLISQPVIFLAYYNNATACFDKCTELTECVTMIFASIRLCILVNVDVDTSMLPDAFKFKYQPNDNGRVAEKICS